MVNIRKLRGPFFVLLSLAVLDLVVIATADVWLRHSPDDYAERVEGCRKQAWDVVFVGGSAVSEGIDPSRFPDGTNASYSLGLPGGTTSEFYHAVKLACPAPPRVLVYGITASDLNDSRHEPHGPASLMSFRDTLEWAHTRPDSREWVVRQYILARVSRVWSLWRYRHGIRMWATVQCEAKHPGSCPDTIREARELRTYSEALRNGSGYAPAAGFAYQRYDHVKAVGGTLAPFAFLEKYKTGSHRKYLHKLIDWTTTNGVQLVLVDMPVSADLEGKYPEAFAEYRQLLAEEERDNRLIVIRAHREVVGLTDADFADMIHLNRVGAMRFSEWLKRQPELIDRASTTDPRRVRAQVGEVGGGRPEANTPPGPGR
jgi:hypothetical protein